MMSAEVSAVHAALMCLCLRRHELCRCELCHCRCALCACVLRVVRCALVSCVPSLRSTIGVVTSACLGCGCPHKVLWQESVLRLLSFALTSHHSLVRWHAGGPCRGQPGSSIRRASLHAMRRGGSSGMCVCVVQMYVTRAGRCVHGRG